MDNTGLNKQIGKPKKGEKGACNKCSCSRCFILISSEKMAGNISQASSTINSSYCGYGSTSSVYKRPLVMILIQAVSMSSIMLVGALANGVILHCIVKQRCLRTVTNAFIFNLAATDFLLSVLCMPFVLISCIAGRWVFGDVLCVMTGFILSMLCIISILTLALISIDRFLAIKRPLKYHDFVTVQNSRRMIIYVWVQGALCSALPALGWGTGFGFISEESTCRPQFSGPTVDNGFTIFLFITCFAVPFSIIAYTYISILWTAHRQFRRVHNTHKPNEISYRPPDDTLNITINSISQRTGENILDTCATLGDEITSAANTVQNKTPNLFKTGRRRRRKTKARGFKKLLIIVTVFLICWSPHFILIFYASLHKQKFPPEVKALTTWLTFLNSACNPFLYGFLNGRFRVGLKTFLDEKLLCCKKRNVDNMTSRVFTIRPNKVI